IQHRKNLSKANWNNNFGAPTVNNYIRQGFGLSLLSSTPATHPETKFNISPNPSATGVFYLDHPDNVFTAFRVMDGQGNLLLSRSEIQGTRTRIDLSNQTSGWYWITGIGKNKPYAMPVLKL
ncbi:MAG: hypothetical protein IT260_23310, partial [Saprospiraceae bacterium]|nr:hypothetical protein [Saprospiraceae bacterium]